jgi:hypothetical protein
MSRFSAASHETAGQVLRLTRQGISLRSVTSRPLPSAALTGAPRSSGSAISADLSTSPWSSDCTFASLARGGWRAVSEDTLASRGSFLLIVRTRHIVTVPSRCDGTRSAGYSDVPAYSQLHPMPHDIGGQRFSSHLRTVPSVTPERRRSGGRHVSGRLSWSPARADYLIPSRVDGTGSAYSL